MGSTFILEMTSLVPQLKGLTALVIVFCLADFGVNTIFLPAVSTDVFITVVLGIFQAFTILAQFFSWFFMLNTIPAVKMGYTSIFQDFWRLFGTTGVYVLLFVITIVVLVSQISRGGDDFYDLWDNMAIVTLWSLERLAAMVHYGCSLYYIVKIFSDPTHFL
jgi:hypothetical protein